MAERINATEVLGVNAGTTANNGETVVFSLRMRSGDDVSFAMKYDLLSPFIANLLGLGTAADELRAKNPIHQQGVQGGYVLDLQTLSIGPNTKKQDWHVLKFLVRGTKGQMHYMIGADRTRLENLFEALGGYLDSLDSGAGPEPAIPH